MAAGDKSIGRLTLDITDVEAKVKRIDTLLKSVGAGKNVSLSAKVANEVKKQLNALEKAIKESISKIQTATAAATKGFTGTGSLQSSIQKVTEETTTMGRAVSGTGATVEKVLGQMRSGFDATGKKVREFADENGNIVKKIYDEQSAFKDALKIVNEYYAKMAQLHALDIGGKKDTPQYTKLLSEVDALREKWKDIDLSIRNVALGTDDAKRAAQLYSDTIKAIDKNALDKGSEKSQAVALKNLITLYQEYYKYKSQADTFAQKGDVDNAQMYNVMQAAVHGYIDAIKLLNPALDAQAQATKQVRDAAISYQTAVQSNTYKEQTERINEYKNALVAMLNEQAKFNQQVVSGRLVEGTDQYKAAEDKLKNLEQAAIQAGQKLDQAGRDAAMGMNEVKTAIDNVNVSMGAMSDSQNVDYLARIKQVYFELTDSIKRYNAEQKINNDTGMHAEQAKIDALMREVGVINSIVSSSKMDASVKQQILNIIQQCTTAETQHNAAMNQNVRSANELESQMTGLLTRMFSIMAVIRTIRNLVNSTVEYVSEYYDKMNEIQIITQKSNAEVAQLADTYRDIAEMMNVSSLDMADAAIYFTRQGLGAAEIEKRLKNVTMYAKTANVEFNDAAEIITAVVNSMGLVEQEAEDGRNAAQRVADVFLLVGDNAATSGQEIGEAMQKAAAAAGSFGVSMEWLASYIATVSETTRQEARTIGTALNTIIARLHSIRTTGYNADDNTKINDIAKALHTVNIELMDQYGNWRDMEDIFADVAGVWDTLTGKQKSYIATTMAGVKQQNVFLALMKDMAKGAENGSRAYELYNLAINSAGTAQEKYATWTDSVLASQERLNVAQEKFYSLLDASVIKSWNDALAGWVNNITKGADVTSGLNIILPVTIGLITALAIAINSAGTASAFFATVWESHPVLVTIAAVTTGVVALVTAISSLASSVETQKDRFDAMNASLSETQTKISSLTSTQNNMSDMFEKLGEKSEITNKDIEKYSSLLDTISKVSPGAKEAVDRFKDGLTDQHEAAEELNEELEKVIKNQNEVAKGQAIRKYLNWGPEDRKNKLLDAYSEFDFSDAEGLTGTYAFSKLLFNEGNKRIMWDHGLNDFYKEYIKKYQEYLLDFAKVYDDLDTIVQKAQETIGAEIWEQFFDANSSSVSDSLLKEINAMIDEVLPMVAFGMDSVETEGIRKQILEHIIGTDGEVSTEEYQRAGIMLADAIGRGISEVDLKQYVDDFRDNMLVEIMDMTGREGLGGGMWNQLSNENLKWVHDLLKNTEVSIVDIENAMADSNSVDEFIAKIGKLSDELQEAGGEPEDEGFVVKIKTITSEIDKLNKMITSLEKGETVDFEDILNFADSHPAIMEAIKDTESLLEVLKQLKQTDIENAINTMRENLLDSVDFANETPFENRGLSLREYLKGQNDSTDVDQYIDRIIVGFLAQTEKLDSVGKEMLAGWMNSLFGDANMDLLDRKILDFGDHIETTMTETIVASADGSKGIKWNQDIVMNFTPITPDGKKLTDDEFYDYIENLLAESTNLEDLKTKDKAENGGLGLLISADVDFLSFEQGIENATKLAELLHLLQEAYYGVAAAEKTWLELQIEQQELEEENNWAKSNGFAEQVGEIQRLLESGGTDGLQLATEYFDGLNKKMKEAIADEYPGLIKALGEAEKALKDESGSADQATKAQNRLNAEIQKINRNNSAQHFDKTYEAIKKLEKGTISAADAYDVFNGEIDKVTKAQEDINDVTQKLAENTEVAENDVSNLASLLGISADQILQDFPGAVDLFNELIGETGDLRAAFDALNEAAFIRITGTSEADFTNIQNGLIATKNMAQEVIDMLVATGQWAVETVPLDGEAWVQQADGSFIKEYLQGFQQILKPTSNNPYKGTRATGNRSNGSSKRNTGGGSSRNNDNGMTEVERILNRMEQVHAIQEYQQSFYQAQNANFEQNGYLQGVIDASQKEIEVLTAQNQTLESNIATIERLIAAKKAELEGLNISSDEYKEVADDLDKLQKAHQNYSKELIENKTSIDKLNESIDEQRKKIRDMEINIRSMIYKAIEDREKKAQDMLNGEIELENKILEIIKKKYEVERDRIIENTEARISALQEERNLLSEQLELRKKMADAEDKAAKLATLEANLKRISADPTRQKEARNIRDQINDLRKEIAWDVAEEEVKAQEDSIDQQITSLEDYKQYVQDYYDDLFKHPQKMIKQMREIIMGTDEEIIDWLKKNDDDFANSSKKTQEKMIGDWKKTVDKMRGTVRTYWEEVEKIVAGGDEAIIQFLMENSEDYAKAGKLEAEKYVAEWKKALGDLHKALQSAFTVEAPTYTPVDPGTGGSTGGSTGGGTGGKNNTEEKNLNHYAMYDDRGIELYYWIDAASDKKAKEKLAKLQKEGTLPKYYTVDARTLTDAQVAAKKKKGGKAFKKGGMADYTGFAWMDGSPTEPERVLSPYQTQLFETMVKALEKIQTINVPTMPNFGSMQTGSNSSVSVGDIIVNVDNLDTDDDYEELAKKVGDVLMDKIGRTAVVGGLRINA